MPQELLREIVRWSADRPAWQRDALRRLVPAGTIEPAELEELLAICKAARGLLPPQPARPLAESQLGPVEADAEPVTLISLTHHQGVNALAGEQTVSFGPQVTVVYGQNAAGKSGYTRVLKQACRARAHEQVLGNVLQTATPLTAAATLRYRKGTSEGTVKWEDGAPALPVLGAISIFDAQCAPVYLKDKTDVAFRPMGLDLFDKLSGTCQELRSRLEREQQALASQPVILPKVAEGTEVEALLSSLTALTDVRRLRTLAKLSEPEQRRLKELQQRQRDLLSTNPKQRAKEILLAASRTDTLVKHCEATETSLGDRAVDRLKAQAASVVAAREAVRALRERTISPDLLKGTGDEAWRALWKAAAAFSAVAFPARDFPVVTDEARCPLCQQDFSQAAAERLKHLHVYATSQAQTELGRVEAEAKRTFQEATRFAVERPEHEPTVTEIAGDDAPLADSIRAWLQRAATVQHAIRGIDPKGKFDVPATVPNPLDGLRARSVTLRARAAQLQAADPALEAALARELQNLEARAVLRESLELVVAEIERLKKLAAYSQCLDDVNTSAVTRKSTELTKQVVTDRLRSRFAEEVKKLEFTHAAVEIQAAGGTRGSLYHRIVFTRAPAVSLQDVLSEGEQRSLSLAAFLTELSTASNASAIVFDDPVSSLDHAWREKIARRLVDEAKTRQVIVFTHDIFFLHALMASCEAKNVELQHQYVRREVQVSGLCSPELPWVAMKVRERIGSLKAKIQEVEKIHRKSGATAYEEPARTVYGMLREAWEQGIVEILLGGTVERYRHSVETQRLKNLHDITEADCQAVDAGMSHCSRWMRGHDQAPGDGTPFPGPDDLKSRIEEFEGWVKVIRGRRD